MASASVFGTGASAPTTNSPKVVGSSPAIFVLFEHPRFSKSQLLTFEHRSDLLGLSFTSMPSIDESNMVGGLNSPRGRLSILRMGLTELIFVV
jgi:hypothetical protein